MSTRTQERARNIEWYKGRITSVRNDHNRGKGAMVEAVEARWSCGCFLGEKQQFSQQPKSSVHIDWVGPRLCPMHLHCAKLSGSMYLSPRMYSSITVGSSIAGLLRASSVRLPPYSFLPDLNLCHLSIAKAVSIHSCASESRKSDGG